MQRKLLKALSLVCVLCLVLTLCSCGKKTNSVKKAKFVSGEVPMLESSDSVAESAKYVLSWDSETANVMITDKQTGRIFSQIPYDYYQANREILKLSNIAALGDAESLIPVLYSPMYATVLTISTDATTKCYANTDVYRKGRVGSEAIEGGIRVTYYFDEQGISVPIDYTVDDDSFNVSVVPAGIAEGNEDNRILEVGLSPMFCCENNSSSAYLVIPSGSGALMYTDTRSEGKARTFTGEIYGTDPAVDSYEKLSNSEAVRLPVFGAVNADSAVYAIIESGAEKCVLNAQVGDAALGVSSAYVSCYVRGYNKPVSTILAGRIRIRTHIVDDITSSEPITVAYGTLSGEKANYTGIARAYSDYLVANGMSESAQSRLLYAEIVGAYQSDELFLGIPYLKTKPLTTYKQAQKIVDDLSEASGGSLIVDMVGFGATGVNTGKIGGNFTLTGVVGNGKSLQNFIKNSADKTEGLYFNFDVVNFKKSGGGFGDTAVSANNSAAKQYSYDISTRLRNTSGFHYLLARDDLKAAAGKAVSTAKKYGIKAISLDSLGKTAYSDYFKTEYFNKEGMGRQVGEIIGDIKEQSVMLSKANGYAAAKADIVLDVPTKSNNNVSFDRNIPFYQIVFKGYVDFANDCINLATNPRTQFLEAVETGSGLSFALTGEYSVDTVLAGEKIFYSSLYEDNAQTVKDLLTEAGAYLKSVSTAKITGHYTNGLVAVTTFDNGVSVYVNYGDADAEADGVTVPANGFKAMKDGVEIE